MPETLRASCVIAVMSLSDSCVWVAMRARTCPTLRCAITSTGSRITATRVSCQLSSSIATKAAITVTVLPMTLETVLLSIGRGFHALVSSRESVELHRMMVSLASQDPKLALMFYQAGPQRVLQEMAALLRRANASGLLQIADPLGAADQFFSLVKGGAHFRLLIGCCAPLEGEAAERHVREAVELFLRAYRR